jgi:hypothetical protein
MLIAVWLGTAATGLYAQETLRLASLQVQIWPEFDRSAALVILRGEIADDATAPSTVTLRTPASSGGPAALASAASADGPLLNLPYERSDAEDFITLRFTTQDRFFQLEFYDRLMVETADRSYRYVWPGDIPVDQLSVQVQQPAGATDFSVLPDLGVGTVGCGGLSYWESERGGFKLGRQFTVDLQYRKTDSRTTIEILGLSTPGSGSAVGTDSDEGIPAWVLVLAVLVALVIGAGAASLWRWQGWPSPASAGRTQRAQRRPEGAAGQRDNRSAFCRQCGSRLRSGNRFCPDCGTPVRRE